MKLYKYLITIEFEERNYKKVIEAPGKIAADYEAILINDCEFESLGKIKEVKRMYKIDLKKKETLE